MTGCKFQQLKSLFLDLLPEDNSGIGNNTHIEHLQVISKQAGQNRFNLYDFKMVSGVRALGLQVSILGCDLRRRSVSRSTKYIPNPIENRIWIKISQILYGLNYATLAQGFSTSEECYESL
jgi:hypothetical protein